MQIIIASLCLMWQGPDLVNQRVYSCRLVSTNVKVIGKKIFVSNGKIFIAAQSKGARPVEAHDQE
ncbi:MAG: hypothetical protein IPH18_10975 [Chitinophagaceae bacterium]|nr:hypothetical protein [Chitinophagaceae bacterium]